MRKPFRTRTAAALHDAHIGPNMTPMVDVVMVILIFFMASAALMGPEWLLKTALPSAKASGAAAPTDTVPIFATIDSAASGAAKITLVVGAGVDRVTTETTLDRLDGVLAGIVKDRGADKLAVGLSPSSGVSYEAVVRVHEACAKAGIVKVGMARPQTLAK